MEVRIGWGGGPPREATISELEQHERGPGLRPTEWLAAQGSGAEDAVGVSTRLAPTGRGGACHRGEARGRRALGRVAARLGLWPPEQGCGPLCLRLCKLSVDPADRGARRPLNLLPLPATSYWPAEGDHDT